MASPPPDSLVAEFRAVANQRLVRIEEAWEQLLKGAGDQVATVLDHELHTLKGESQMIGFTDVNLLCHKLEDLLEVARSRGYAVDEDLDLMVAMAVRFMGMLSRKRIGARLGGVDLPGFVRQIDDVLGQAKRDFTSGGRTRTSASATPPVLHDGEYVPPSVRAKLSLPAADAFIEYAVARGHRRNRLREAWQVLRDVVGIHFATIGSSQLEKHRLGAQTVALGLRKQLEVQIDVAPTEITTEVLATVDMAVLHLIRNAIDHGIELPNERIAVGKHAAGKLQVRGGLHEGALVISIADDGRGIDFLRARERAIALGLIDSTTEVAADRWIEILSQPGFSTRDVASIVSGRGLGLDAVRVAVVALGGKLEVTSEEQIGSIWTIRLPLPSLTVRGMLLQVPGLAFPIMLEGWEPTKPSRTPRPFDIGRVLGLSETGSASGTVAVFARGKQEIALMLEAPAKPIEARRLVATGPKGLYEVVFVDSREGLLVRPEVLLGER